MTDDDEQIPGVTQTQLMQDIVFDRSVALKPAKRSTTQSKKPKNYSPDYDPDTIDLFGDIATTAANTAENSEFAAIDNEDKDQASFDADGSISTELSFDADTLSDTTTNATTITDDPTIESSNKQSQAINQELRGELTDELTSILDDLDDQQVK